MKPFINLEASEKQFISQPPVKDKSSESGEQFTSFQLLEEDKSQKFNYDLHPEEKLSKLTSIN